MIGLDTNVVVRYLIQDDPRQSKQATQMIEKTVANGQTFWISLISLCEVIWVLERCYDINKVDLIRFIKQLLITNGLKIENETVVRQAVHDFEKLPAVDFSDCLIGKQNRVNDCIFTYTFDRNAAKKMGSLFKLVI